MDGLHKLDAALPGALPSQAGQVLDALAGGASVLLTSGDGVAGCLPVVAQMLGASRTRVVQVRPPLELPDVLDQVACAFPAPGEAAVERAFDALTEPGPACDRIVLLVEDAHLMPHPTLHYIEMAMRAGPQLQVVLSGQPALGDVLGLAGFTSLRQRLSARVDAATGSVPAPVGLAASPAREVPTHVPRPRRWRRAALAGALAAGIAVVWMARPTGPVPAPESATAGVAQQLAAVLSAPDAPPAPSTTPAEAAAPTTALPAADAEPPVAAAPVPPTPDAPQAAEAVPHMVAEPAPEMVEMPPPAPEALPDLAVAPLPEPPPATVAAAPVPVPTPPAQPPLTSPPPSPGPVARPAFHPAPHTVRERPAPPRTERASAPAPPQNDRRCRDIVLRAQLGDTPTDADRSFLRNGCR